MAIYWVILLPALIFKQQVVWSGTVVLFPGRLVQSVGGRTVLTSPSQANDLKLADPDTPLSGSAILFCRTVKTHDR